MGVSEFMWLKLCVNSLKWKKFKTLGHEMVMANWHLFLKGILFFCLSFHNILANRYQEDVGHKSITRQVNATLTGVFIFFGKLICLSLLSSLRAIPQSTRFLFIIFFSLPLQKLDQRPPSLPPQYVWDVLFVNFVNHSLYSHFGEMF